MNEAEAMSPIRSVTHARLRDSLAFCEKSAKTPMIWGAPGIGKTVVVHDYGKGRARDLQREFKIWHQLTPGEKMELFVNPEVREKTYFIYDNRAASNDTTDDKGIPNITNGNYLEWLPNMAYLIFSMPETRGILFNDELTLAPTLVQNSMYKMVHDHAVGDISFNPYIFIVCAGNRMQDKAFVQETPLPLRTRMIHFWLVEATPKAQQEYFVEIGIDRRIIGFFGAHPNLYFHYKDGSEEFTACTPRTIEFFSELLQDNNLSYPEHDEAIMDLACGALSSYVGHMFVKFLKHTREINLDKYLKHPEKVSELTSLDEQYGLLMLLADRFKRTEEEHADGFLKSVMGIFEHLHEEIGTLMLRMIKKENVKKFIDSARTVPEIVKVMQRISPIVVADRKVV